MTVADTHTSLKVTKSLGYVNLYNQDHKYFLFDTLQFHFHSPSEHTIDGEHRDLELHIVHRKHEGTDLAVIGIFFDREKGGN